MGIDRFNLPHRHDVPSLMQDANPAAQQAALKAKEAAVIEAHQGMVQDAVQKLQKQLALRVERDDLVAYGNMGLLDAWRRYDPARGAAFSTFAYYRIRGAIRDGCRKEGWLPRTRKVRPKTHEALAEHLEAQHDANLQAPEARTLTESVSRVSDMVGSAITLILVEQSELEQVELPSAHERADHVIEKKDDNDMLNEAIKQLDPEERILIKRHHYYGDSITDIAHDLGKSKSWCSRMHARALERLRDILAPPDDQLHTG